MTARLITPEMVAEGVRILNREWRFSVPPVCETVAKQVYQAMSAVAPQDPGRTKRDQ